MNYSFDWSNIGKRLKSPKDMILYNGFPLSNEVEFIPAGAISGEITSYIEKKNSKGINEIFFQIDNTGYILKTDEVEVVDYTAQDESSVFSDAAAWYASKTYNGRKKLENAGKNLREGFEETKNRSFFEMLDFAGLGDVKKSLIIGAAVFIGYIILSLILKLK